MDVGKNRRNLLQRSQRLLIIASHDATENKATSYVISVQKSLWIGSGSERREQEGNRND